jgi:hypothetical protein
MIRDGNAGLEFGNARARDGRRASGHEIPIPPGELRTAIRDDSDKRIGSAFDHRYGLLSSAAALFAGEL